MSIEANLDKISKETGIILPTLCGYRKAKTALPSNIYKLACFFYSNQKFDNLRNDVVFEEFFEKSTHICRPGRVIQGYYAFDFADNTCSVLKIAREVSSTETDQTLVNRSKTSFIAFNEVLQKVMNLEYYALNNILLSFYDDLCWQNFVSFMNDKKIYDMFTTLNDGRYLNVKRTHPSICFSQAKDFLKDYSDPLLFE